MKRGPSKSGNSPELKTVKKSEDSEVQNRSSEKKLKRGPSKSENSPESKSLKKSEESQVQNHSSDSDIEVLEDPEEVRNSDIPENVENADNSKKVENSDAPENVENTVISENVENSDMPGNVENQDTNENEEKPVIPEKGKNPVITEKKENPVIPENVENSDKLGTVKNQDTNENVEKPVIPEKRENSVIPENVENSDKPGNAENQDTNENVENQDISQNVKDSEDSEKSSTLGDSENPDNLQNGAEESEESSSAKESDSCTDSSENGAPVNLRQLPDLNGLGDPENPVNQQNGAEESEESSSVRESDSSAESSQHGAPVNLSQLPDLSDLAPAPRRPRCYPGRCVDCLNNIDYHDQNGVRRGVYDLAILMVSVDETYFVPQFWGLESNTNSTTVNKLFLNIANDNLVETAIDQAEQLKVLCIGQCCLDLVKTCETFPTEHSIHSCINFRHQRGGSASNVCTVLRIMNQRSEYFGVLSDGPFCSFLEEDMRYYKVEFIHCQRRQDLYENPTSVVILSRATQSQTIIHYNQNYPEQTNNNFLEICLCNYTWVHFEGRNVEESLKMMYTIIRHNDIISSINRKAHETGLLHVPINVSVELKHARVGVMDLVAHAHVVFITEQFARTQRFESIGQTIRHIRQFTRPNAVILSYWGERGAMGCAATGDTVQSPSFISTNWVDPLGSQDVFTAAVIHFLNQEKISGLRDAPDEEPEPIQQKVQHLQSCFDRETVQRACTFGCQCAGVKVGFAGYEGLKPLYGAYLDE